MSQTSDSESSIQSLGLSSCETVISEPKIPDYSLNKVKISEQEIAYALAREGSFIPGEERPLSDTYRGTTTILQDPKGHRFVCRASKFVQPEQRTERALRHHLRKSGDRILRFGNYWYDRQNEAHSLVPILSVPRVMDDSWLIEKYEEVSVTTNTGKPMRLDLHKYCTQDLPDCFQADDRAPRAVGFLHHIVRTVADLHDHSWVHLDISLENIALSNTQAYLIDFESALQFTEESKGFIQMGHIKVPLKLPFVPPENFTAKKSDLVSLPSYDVWSLGCMLFAVLFRRYPFSFSSRAEGQEPSRRELRYFTRKGFDKFVKKYHRSVYQQLLSKDEEWTSYAHDLLKSLFVAATPVRNRRTKVIRYDVEKRFSARQMCEHPFWQIYGDCIAKKSEE